MLRLWAEGRVGEQLVNWICRPSTAQRWAPPPGPAHAALTDEAALLAAFRAPRAQRAVDCAIEVGNEVAPLPPPAVAGAPLLLLIAGPGAAPSGDAPAARVAEAVVVGVGAVAALSELRAALQPLRGDLEALALSWDKRCSGTEGSRRRRRDASNEASSSSERKRHSRSGPAGSGSDRRRRRRRMASWHLCSIGKRDKITHEVTRNMETLKFRTRTDLIRLSSERPGALACQFLLAVRQTLNAEPAQSSPLIRAARTAKTKQNDNAEHANDHGGGGIHVVYDVLAEHSPIRRLMRT